MSAQPATLMRLPSLARKMVDTGLLSEEKALELAAQANEKRRTFTSHIVREKAVDALGFAHLAAEDFGMPLIDLAAVNLKYAPVKQVKEELLRKHLIVPILKRGNRLFVATADPGNKSGMDELTFTSGLAVEAVLAPYNAIEPALDRAMAGSSEAFSELTKGEDDLENLGFGDTAEEEDEASDSAGSDDAPVVRFVNKVLIDAIRKDASDIHFEPYEEDYRVRFRIDGVLVTQVRPPKRMAPRLSARLKVMSNLDIAERRVPQDGRIKLNISKGTAYDFRVSTCPTNELSSSRNSTGALLSLGPRSSVAMTSG